MRKINTINLDVNPFEKQEKLRVCAYTRVSTNNPKQVESLDNQIQYYTDKLNSNPDYINCGVFVDKGVSGNKGERPGLDEILRKARAGDLDLIITKSVSRFARNTVMLLSLIRELKELGVGIIFEEQKIHTLSADGEFMLTVLGAMAEEERKAVCSNIRWAVKRRFQNGEGMVDTNRLLGYDKDKNGELVINQEQAPIVRRIFDLYLQNIPGTRIAKILIDEGVPTYYKHPWTSQRILRIISNEKYVGDFMMQKSFVDHRGKEVINRGEKPKYYVKAAMKGKFT